MRLTIKTMTSNGKQFTVDRCCTYFSKYALILFCFAKLLNDWSLSLGNSEVCFLRISMFPSALICLETLRFSGNKIHCSPRDQSLSVKYYYTSVYLKSSSTVISNVFLPFKDFILKLPGITFKNYRYNLKMPSTF